jgi:hypothetical protein
LHCTKKTPRKLLYFLMLQDLQPFLNFILHREKTVKPYFVTSYGK